MFTTRGQWKLLRASRQALVAWFSTDLEYFTQLALLVKGLNSLNFSCCFNAFFFFYTSHAKWIRAKRNILPLFLPKNRQLVAYKYKFSIHNPNSLHTHHNCYSIFSIKTSILIIRLKPLPSTLTHSDTHFLTCTAHRKSRRSLRSSCREWRARALTKSNKDRMGS